MIAVLFEAEAHPEHQMRYLQLAADLKPLLMQNSGFSSLERFQSLTDEKKISRSPGGAMKNQCWPGSATSVTRPQSVKAARPFLPVIVFASSRYSENMPHNRE